MPPGFNIPESLKTEADTLKAKVDALNLPKIKGPDGQEHPDICKITDATIKAEVTAFAAKVTAAGGTLPLPPCF